MKNVTKKLLLLIFIPALAFSFSGVRAEETLSLASFSMEAPNNSIKNGQTFKLDVNYLGNGHEVDTIRINLAYPADLIGIKEVEKNAAFSFTAGDNLVNNEKGQFSFAAGIPGGTIQSGRFLSLNFFSKAPGDAPITLTDSSLILSNGENIYDRIEKTVTITVEPAEKILGAKMYFDGALLRGHDNRIYLIINGQKKPIRTLLELSQFINQPIIDVDDWVLESYLLYEPCSDTGMYGDGNLLRDSISMRIYLVGNGEKMLISSLKELSKYAGQPIFNVSSEELEKFPLVEYVRMGLRSIPNKTLAKDSASQRIFWIENGYKKYIPTLAELNKYSRYKMAVVDFQALRNYPLAW